jgi:hypothetical protein
MLEKAHRQFRDGELTRLASEVAEHKRDPYTLVEGIVESLGKGEGKADSLLRSS